MSKQTLKKIIKNRGVLYGSGLVTGGAIGAGAANAAADAAKSKKRARELQEKQAALSPEMKAQAAATKSVQDPSKPGVEVAPKQVSSMIERARKNKPSPLSEMIRRKKMDKKSALNTDGAFDADMSRMMGVEPTADVDFARPDVSTGNYAVDRIDQHFLGWMNEKAGEDVVKEANGRSEILKRVLTGGDKTLSRELLKAKAKGALGGLSAAGLAAGGTALYHKGKRDERAKHAGVIEHDENLDLMARLRKRAASGLGISNDA